MDIDKAIKDRRSIRKFTDDYIDDNTIKDLLEAARWAPSWANTQAWEFIIVRDTGLIKEVVDTYSPKNPATSGSLAASALIVACAKTGVSGCYNGKDATSISNWFMFDLGLAVENLCLKAHSLGLGTVVVGLMDQKTCKQVLDVPDSHEVVAVIPVGIPQKTRPAPERKDLAAFVHLNKFGTQF
ncbi:MAG: nitroreductase family protein [Thermodesulfobacteriota bacterium]|nr:nitroreductase family protein [Thermodesulfobacteriota bacterium]